MMLAMIVILVAFAFILVMGGVDSAPKDDGTVAIRIDKEHAREMADLFRELLCDRFEYNSRHERQRDQDIIGDVLNTTAPPDGLAPGREMWRKVTNYANLPKEEQQALARDLELFGIPLDLSRMGGGGADDILVPEDEFGASWQTRMKEFDDKAGVDDTQADGAEKAPAGEQQEEEKKARKAAPAARKPRVSAVRTEESDRKKSTQGKKTAGKPASGPSPQREPAGERIPPPAREDFLEEGGDEFVERPFNISILNQQ